jgi:type II secretory pathway pseudopilin PulG
VLNRRPGAAAVVGALAVAAAPVPAPADDAARLSQIESEIQQLRRQIDEQGRRLQRLEDALGRAGVAVPNADPRRRPSGASLVQPGSKGAQPWHQPQAWDRVTKGMTAEEVTAVLGEPTAVESVDGFKTMFYRGAAPGGASLDGIVNLRDERVVAIARPKF